MIETNLNIVPNDPFLVLIALNPTEEAIQNKAVFSRDEGFWNLLREAELIDDVSHLPLSERAIEVFSEQKKYSKKKIGFADLLPLIHETDSKKVKPEKGSAIKLLEDVPNICKAKKIGLLGQKVVDAFAEDYKLTKWSKIEVIAGEKQFGKIGLIGQIEIFAMPFPVNNKIANKHNFYKLLV